MNIQKLIDYIPAVLILVSIMIITLVILNKRGDKIFDGELKPGNILLYLASFLFVVILITHLFREQAWTADTLKVLVGILVGAASSKVAESMELSGKDIINSIVNQAKGNIDQKIDNLKSEFSKFENAVVNQNDSSTQPVITKVERLNLETNDLEFLSHLEQVWDTSENRTWKWIEECIKYPAFQRSLTDKIKSLESEGWKVKSLNLDNTNKGIQINMEIEKSLKLFNDN